MRYHRKRLLREQQVKQVEEVVQSKEVETKPKSTKQVNKAEKGDK